MDKNSIPEAFQKALMNDEEVLAITKKHSLWMLGWWLNPINIILGFFTFGLLFLYKLHIMKNEVIIITSKRIIGSGCSGIVTFYRDIDARRCVPLGNETEYSYQKISSLMRQFQQSSLTFKHTGGVHSCALCSQEGMEIFTEDIGRHNAMDKIFGECFIKGISIQDKFILTSGRVSSEILIKAVKQKVPIIASHSAPTDLAVGLAEKLNLTLIGFVRGCRMNIYTNNYRII